MDKLERFVSRIQGPPVISTISNKYGAFKEKRHTKWGKDWHKSSIIITVEKPWNEAEIVHS